MIGVRMPPAAARRGPSAPRVGGDRRCADWPRGPGAGHRCWPESTSPSGPARCCALVGPNGAGKSTLLGAIGGDVAVHRGDRRWTARRSPRGATRAGDAAGDAAAAADRVFPFTVAEVVEMGRAPVGGHAAGGRRRRGRRRGLARGPTSTGSRTAPTRRCRAANRRGSRWRGCWRSGPASCCWTSRPPPSTCTTRRWSSASPGNAPRAGAAVVACVHDLALAAAYADRVALLADGRVPPRARPARSSPPRCSARSTGTTSRSSPIRAPGGR